MSDIKHRDRILEAIDQLRRRKARPDVQRICNFLMRRFSINWNDARDDLQKCVERDIVLKVKYKGDISYRNATKKFSHAKGAQNNHYQRAAPTSVLSSSNSNNHQQPVHYPQHQQLQQQISRKFGALLTNAIAELIVHEPDYLEVGIPAPELIRTILLKDNVRYTKKYVSFLLEKEVRNGGLVRMENGNYLLGPKKESASLSESETEKVKIERKDSNSNGDYRKKDRKKTVKLGMKKVKMENGELLDNRKNFKSSENGMLRVGSRRKRAKKVFDPSDNNIPRKRGRPVGSVSKATIEKHVLKHNDGEALKTNELSYSSSSSSTSREQGGVCSVCHNNKKVPHDRLVSCRECSNKAHMSCLNGDDMMLKMYPDNTWQCPHCKTCCVCYETADAGYLTICSVCADAYHATCHEPNITEKIRSGTKWLCMNCQMPDQLQVEEIHPNVNTSDVFRHQDISDEVRIKERSLSPILSISDDSNHNSMPPSPTPPTLSPQTTHNGIPSPPEIKCSFSDSQSVKDLDIDDIIDPSIPDASHWTYEDVYNYFVRYFPEEAKVFREQEIDGRSLLLMKRMDVLNSLKLKLGPALKIYRHVVKLQFRRDDPKLYWL